MMMRAMMAATMLIATATMSLAATVPITVQNPAGVALEAEPVTTGVPFPESALAVRGQRPPARRGQREELPLQVTVTGELPGRLGALAAAGLPGGPATRRHHAHAGVRRGRGAGSHAASSRAGGCARHQRPFLHRGLERTLTADMAIRGPYGGPYFVDDAGVQYRDRIWTARGRGGACGSDAHGHATARRLVRERRRRSASARPSPACTPTAASPGCAIFYTFIMTEDSRELRFSDIGLRIPMPVERVVFGTGDGPVGATQAPRVSAAV
jgi:hypothetical protein